MGLLKSRARTRARSSPSTSTRSSTRPSSTTTPRRKQLVDDETSRPPRPSASRRSRPSSPSAARCSRPRTPRRLRRPPTAPPPPAAPVGGSAAAQAARRGPRRSGAADARSSSRKRSQGSPAPGKRLGEYLVDTGILDERDLAAALAHQFNLEVVDLRREVPAEDAVESLPEENAREWLAIPLRRTEFGYDVAVADPSEPGLAEKLRDALRQPAKLYVGGVSDVRRAIDVALQGDLARRRARPRVRGARRGASGRAGRRGRRPDASTRTRRSSRS